MRRFIVELNGVANIHAIVQMMEMDIAETGHVTYTEMNKHLANIKEQLDLLNRYMTCINDINPELKAPMWYDVREHKHSFPNNKGEK